MFSPIPASLPQRITVRPQTSAGLPHEQLDQFTDQRTYQSVVDFMAKKEAVILGTSSVGTPGTIAFFLEEKYPSSRLRMAYLIPYEFAHIHPFPDGSLHASLPPRWVELLIAKGWGELHPLAGKGQFSPTIVLLYAPQNAAELRVVENLLTVSYEFARGDYDSFFP